MGMSWRPSHNILGPCTRISPWITPSLGSQEPNSDDSSMKRWRLERNSVSLEPELPSQWLWYSSMVANSAASFNRTGVFGFNNTFIETLEISSNARLLKMLIIDANDWKPLTIYDNLLRHLTTKSIFSLKILNQLNLVCILPIWVLQIWLTFTASVQ